LGQPQNNDVGPTLYNRSWANSNINVVEFANHMPTMGQPLQYAIRQRPMYHICYTSRSARSAVGFTSPLLVEQLRSSVEKYFRFGVGVVLEPHILRTCTAIAACVVRTDYNIKETQTQLC